MADRAQLRDWDLQHVWHPYTQMRDFARDEFPIITHASGRKLIDADGREYWDGTASMWLNVHGHQVPELDEALRAQLGKVAHSTLLAQAGEASILLARRLAHHTRMPRAFFSDNGSTAVESAIKMALQYWHLEGHQGKSRIASFDGAYHGDTLGAIAAAPVPEFHAAFRDVLGPGPVRLRWPDTTRGPHPRDPDATRDWALGLASDALSKHRKGLAAVVVEPLVQCVGGLRIMPPGYLRGLRQLCTESDVLLIADEVATAFGRTGTMLACEHEDVTPDLLALGKGLTGGYLPLAATMASDAVYEAFLGEHSDMRAFYHGHSYTGNALGCAVASANLDLLEGMLPGLPAKAEWLGSQVAPFSDLPFVGEVRHKGFLVGFDLVKDKRTMEPFAWQSRAGWAIHLEARKRGLLARPYASTGLFVPPIASTREELSAMLAIYHDATLAATPALERLAQESWPRIQEVP